MPNYKNGKIYKVICSETQSFYIGSTTQPLSKRLCEHKTRFNNCLTKSFITPKIYLVEDFSCERKEQLLMRERYHIENTDCVNLRLPLVTNEERKDYLKNRYENNKEKILKQHQEYRENNKEKIKEDTKIYKNKNKEIIRIKNKIYEEKNKEKIAKRKSEKITCECGVIIAKGGFSKHIKSKKHSNNLKNP